MNGIIVLLSDVDDLVQIGLFLYANLFPIQSLAQLNRSWMPMQNDEKRLFGDIHIQTGMSTRIKSKYLNMRK